MDFQQRPKSTSETPESAQDVEQTPEKCPKGGQEASKRDQERPKAGQETPKRRQRVPQPRPKFSPVSPNLPRSLWEALFDKLRERCCVVFVLVRNKRDVRKTQEKHMCFLDFCISRFCAKSKPASAQSLGKLGFGGSKNLPKVIRNHPKLIPERSRTPTS